MLLTPYGFKEWLTISVIAALIAAVAITMFWWWLVVLIAIIWLALLSFFRDPIRRVPTNLAPGTMLSPADGTISAVFTVDHHDATGGPAQVIRIFLSVLNVHVNRSPFDATVVKLTYTPGKYLNAMTEESAKVNESNLITLSIATGQAAEEEENGGAEMIGVRQVSGMIARRIVCPIKPGDTLKRGQRFGMIKFGSTTELILPRPEDVEVRVKKGDKVAGGRTILAVLPPQSPR